MVAGSADLFGSGDHVIHVRSRRPHGRRAAARPPHWTFGRIDRRELRNRVRRPAGRKPQETGRGGNQTAGSGVHRDAMVLEAIGDRVEAAVTGGRQPWRRATLTGLAVAVIAALAVVVRPRLDLRRDSTGPGGPGTPTPAPSAPEGFFIGFYPVTTLEDARRLQESVDNGHQPLILDPAEVARQFARDYIGWQRVELGRVTKDGSAVAGWKATVELRPYVGEGKSPSTLGTRHVVELVGLEGAEEPTWFVTAIRSDNIVLDALMGGPGPSGLEPFRIRGKGTGFEGTIHTQIKDDTGAVLHPRKGRQDEGYVQGGSTELAPFEGTLAYDQPATPAGVLSLTGDTGLDRPAPDWTVVRLSFSRSAERE